MEGEDEPRTISMPIRRGRSSGYDVLQLAIPESGHSTCSSRLDGGQLELPLSLRIETLVGLPRSFSPFSVLFSPPFPLASSPTGSMVANPTPLKPIIGASLSPCLALIYPSMVSITSSDTNFSHLRRARDGSSSFLRPSTSSLTNPSPTTPSSVQARFRSCSRVAAGGLLKLSCISGRYCSTHNPHHWLSPCATFRTLMTIHTLGGPLLPRRQSYNAGMLQRATIWNTAMEQRQGQTAKRPQPISQSG